MPNDNYIGIDLGTSVAKGVLMSDAGVVLATTSRQLPLETPSPDWAEQEPEAWWGAVSSILRELKKAGGFSKVKGIGLSGQMHGLVCYDDDLNPIRNAIVWLDRRSNQEVDDILETVGHNQLYRITGNPVFNGFLLPSLLWVKRNEPRVFGMTSVVSSPKDFLALQLTGKLRTEPTDALATGAFDRVANDWSSLVLEAVGLERSLFPEVAPTSQPYGGLLPEVAKRFGLPAGIPVYGGSDQAMGAMGLGLVKPGQAMVALATGGQFVVIGEPGLIDNRRRLHTLSHGVEKTGMYMAATLSAALSMRWFKEEVIQDTKTSYPDFYYGIQDIPAGSDGVIFHPYLAGERTPYFNSALRGGFYGLSVAHNQKHLQRAIIEGVSFSMKQCLHVFEQMNMPIRSIILTGGGAKNPIWQQIMADVLNRSMEISTVTDHSPFGAAVFAKFAPKKFVGLSSFYKSVINKGEEIKPNPASVKIYEPIFEEYVSIADAKHRRARRKQRHK